MTIGSQTATTHWAVIIGVNYYREPEYKCLKGCVRDAMTVKHFLEERETDADIIVLTATTPTDASLTRPPEEPEVWPTYENITSSLRRIINMAKGGDFVHIHYSGHGVQLPSLSQSGQPNAVELALVLLSADNSGSRYFRGQYLANALHKMVEKGLRVILVLDCCFSGSMVRNSDWHGFEVRSIDYNPSVDAASLQEQSTSLFDATSTLRDSSMEKDWLLNPDGYAILSACAPHERAYELETVDGIRGALTYFLLDALSTLRNRGVELTHQSIHEQLSTKFHVSWPRQTPVRYGNENFAFFGGSLLPPDDAFVPIYETKGGKLCLRAGYVHGVYEGDEYAVYPFDAPEHANDHEVMTLWNMRVDVTRAFESELIEIDPLSALTQSQMGWKAKPLTSLSPRYIPIKLLASIRGNSQLEETAKALRFMRLFTEDQTAEPCIFNVTVNEHDEYEIVDALYDKVACVPNIPCNSKGSTQTLMNVLEHLATFKYFEGVENRLPSTAFESSVSLTPKCPADISGVFDVKHDTKWEFIVENSGHKPLYLAVFNFAPSWRIKNLISQAGGGGYKIIPPKKDGTDGRRLVGLRMKVPEFLQNCAKGQCEDIIKIFITSRPTSFPLMVLPEISHTANSAFRGIHSGDDLSDFLLKLATGMRGQDEDAWLTQNFIIRTVLD